jgi:hypothetical protein
MAEDARELKEDLFHILAVSQKGEAIKNEGILLIGEMVRIEELRRQML